MPRFPMTLGLALVLACSAVAQKRQQERAKDQGKDKEDLSNVSDQDFVLRAATADMAEVDLGYTSASRSSSSRTSWSVVCEKSSYHKPTARKGCGV